MKKFKVGDKVKVISGKDKGKFGEIKVIYHKKNQILIEGINSKIKHIKPQQKNEVGRITQSNDQLIVQILCFAMVMTMFLVSDLLSIIQNQNTKRSVE